MSSLYETKPRFQDVLRPLVRSLARIGVTPNQVTITAIVLSFLAGGLLWGFRHDLNVLFVIPIVTVVRLALNVVDGMLAKEYDMKSPLGNLLNELGDVFSDAAIYLPLAFITGFSDVLVVVLVVLAVIGEMTGVLGVVIGGTRRYDGPMGKSDRAFLLSALSLAIAAGVPVAGWVNMVLAIIVGLSAVTLVNRVRRSLEEVVR